MRLIGPALFAVVSVLVGGMTIASAATPSKVPVCHVPAGSHAHPRLIVIGETAAARHARFHNDAICPDDATDCCLSDSGASMCTDLQNDSSNCGECGVMCGVGATCVSGRCACGPKAIVCNGVCVEPAIDRENCGDCDVMCGDEQACVAGQCVTACLPEEILCNGVCIDPETDAGNCGDCGVLCGVDQDCVGGICLVTCPSGE